MLHVVSHPIFFDEIGNFLSLFREIPLEANRKLLIFAL